MNTAQAQKGTKVLIKTTLGDITVLLYDDTPQHRDNFIKLVEQGFYNGSIFHRVIKDFMVQGGGAPAGQAEVNYLVPAEFNSKYIHKKGALAAARMADYVNPERKSSGSQFYIVQGKVVPPEQLTQFEAYHGKQYTAEQKEIYSTIGGTPHLDYNYTVFGEVISGLDVVDKIAAVKNLRGDKPENDIKMTVSIVK